MAILLPSHGAANRQHAIEMIQSLPAKLGNLVLDIRWQRASTAMRVHKNGDEGLRHACAGPAAIDAQGLDTLAPDLLRQEFPPTA
jgi:hypothetical protein